MKDKALFISTGFALFAMFFGSGNLVFPITVGKESEGHYIMASLGILFTGVLVPFLGVLGMMLFKGSIKGFFKSFGKKGIFLFSFMALALMGPFGVLARCLTVAHGALTLLLPDLSLPVASLGMCAVIYFLAMNKNSIVTNLGKFLTPFLLASIGLIAFFGFTHASIPETVTTTSLSYLKALKNGYFQGYQTMDLLAAFFFSQFVISHLKNKFPEADERSQLLHFYKAALVGAGLLSTVYFALVVLGWTYSPALVNVAAQEMFGRIALEALGPIAAPCVCIAVLFACLTTALVLTSLFGDFLNHEMTKNKLGNHLSLLVTLGISFVVSTFDFAGIARFIGPILETVYPALIALTVVNIATHILGARTTHWPFTCALFAKLCWV